MQAYYGLGLSLQSMAGPVYLGQALGFAIEALGCGVTLLVMVRLGCRVTVAYSMLQGECMLLKRLCLFNLAASCACLIYMLTCSRKYVQFQH